MTTAAGDLEKGERKSLQDALGNLKQVSIGSTCRALVKTHCGAPAAKYFTRAYDIRSQLVHQGEPPSGTDLAAELWTLNQLVSQLILRHVASSWQS